MSEEQQFAEIAHMTCHAEGPDFCRWDGCPFPGPFGPVDRSKCFLIQPPALEGSDE